MARRLVEQRENFNPLCPVSDATDSAVTRLVSVFSFPNPPVLDLERGRVSRRDEPGFPAGVRPVGITGSTPVIELVAVRILELARLGEVDIDRLVDAAVATFDEGGAKGSQRW